MSEENGICLQAQVDRIAMTVDNGWKITFALGEHQTQELLKLDKIRGKNIVIVVMEKK